MKTEYVKPEIMIEEVELVNMIAASVRIGEDVEEVSADAHGHRGSWGDLWD